LHSVSNLYGRGQVCAARAQGHWAQNGEKELDLFDRS
jgi:hypothetical protein